MSITLGGMGERVWRPSPLQRVDIVAMGASAIEFVIDSYHAPLREADHEVWTLNSGPLCYYFDKVWNMHDLTKLHKQENEVDYRPLYKTLKKPLITVRAMEELPTSIEFPLGDFIKEYQINYFANTVAYMVAGAIMCNVKELHVYGADYNYPNKEMYEAGRPCVEFWLGYAKANGISVQSSKSGTLMDMCHRWPGNNGARGYGEVYGYFDEQPELDANGTLIGFKKPMLEIEDESGGLSRRS